MTYRVELSMMYGDWNPKKTDKTFDNKKSAQEYLQDLVDTIPSRYFRVKFDNKGWECYEDYIEDFIVERSDNYVIMSNEWWVKFVTPETIRVEIIENN